MPIAPSPVASTASTIKRPIITHEVAYAARTTSSILATERIGTSGSASVTPRRSTGTRELDAPWARTTSVTSRDGLSANAT